MGLPALTRPLSEGMERIGEESGDSVDSDEREGDTGERGLRRTGTAATPPGH